MSKKYVKPQIKERKIKINSFLNSRFLDSADTLLVAPVFAQSGCGTLTSSGCVSTSSSSACTGTCGSGSVGSCFSP